MTFWLTLTYFTAWLKLATCQFEWENCYKVIKYDQINRRLYYRKKNFYHRGFSAPARGYMHVYDHYFQTTFLETAWPIKTKLYVEPSWKEGM